MQDRALKELWDRPVPRQNPLLTVYEILFACVAVINYILLTFDALYLYPLPYYRLTLRDMMLHSMPRAVSLYDPVKGIQPHRFTVSYEEDYNALKKRFADRAGAPATESAAKDREIDALLAALVEKSRDMIDRRSADSHFYLAEKDGVLEMIKNAMRRHLPNPNDSAKESFATFFSRTNLTEERRAAQFAFFDREILPLMQENYFRWIGEDGKRTDFFYRIDRWFVLFFLLDFVLRWGFALHGKKYRTWYLFPIHNAFDIFLLFPPHHSAAFRLLRAIPIFVRLKRNRFIPDDGVLPNVIHNNARLIASEISGLVAMNILEETRQSLDSGGNFSFSTETVEAMERLISGRMEAFSRQVMPEIEPGISELVQYAINRAMEPYLLSPLGPIVRLILMNVHATVREGLEASLSGPEGTERLARILQKAVSEFLLEITDERNRETLMKDLSQFLVGLQRDIEEEMGRSTQDVSKGKTGSSAKIIDVE